MVADAGDGEALLLEIWSQTRNMVTSYGLGLSLPREVRCSEGLHSTFDTQSKISAKP